MSINKHIRFDWAIKKILRNKANFVILEGFLSELLFEDIVIQEILESESNKEDASDKSNRVDILVKNSLGELILIEVQNEKEHDYFHRMIYGSSKLITQYLNQGEVYSKIKKVISINIVYFDLGQGEDYIYQGQTEFVGLHKKDVLAASTAQKELYKIAHVANIFPTYYILKLNSFDNVAKDSLDEWIYFLKNSEIPDGFQAKGIQAAKKALRIDMLNGPDKVAYEQYIKEDRIRRNEIESAILDERAKLIPQIEEANAKAEEERRQKELLLLQRKNLIVNLLKNGMPKAEVSQMMGLSLEDIDISLN